MSRTLQFETPIGCSVEALFAFHSDTQNLSAITPPGITVNIIELPAEPVSGSRAVLQIRRGLLGFRWELRFETIAPPNRIVDVALRSPFASFRHEHLFMSLQNDHSLLIDKVTFSLPLGWLGRRFEWLVARDLKTMFGYRHAKTAEILQTGDGSV